MTRSNIVITGASSGLGEEMARQFAAKGRNLALCARRSDRITALRDELRATHPGITVCARPLDVNDHAAVFATFGAFRDELGGIDRVVVNAGIGKGVRVGTGGFAVNAQTLSTNVVAALAQCEAAMAIFREQRAGHLVVISSVAACRGLPGASTAYAASKAALSSLAEGIRADVVGSRIAVTTIEPGFIRSGLNPEPGSRPFMVGTEKGVRSIVAAVEREGARARVPAWPWAPLAGLLKVLPLRLLAKVG